MKTLLVEVLLLLGLLSFSGFAHSRTCPAGFYYETCEGTQVGPGPCVPGCKPILDYIPPIDPGPSSEAPTELCFPAGCSVIQYIPFHRFIIAESKLPNGYPMIGFSGPCMKANCPEMALQAYYNLFWNARQANRANRYY